MHLRLKSTLATVVLLNIFIATVEMNEQLFEAKLWNLRSDLIKDLKISNNGSTNMLSFKKAIEKLGITQNLQSITSCSACQIMVKEIQDRSLSAEVTARAVCNIYFLLQTWKLSYFCRDLLQLNLPILSYIVKNSKILEPKLACSILLQNNLCYYESDPLSWTIKVTPESEKKIPEIEYGNTANKPLKILHLTDIHITPDYQVNSVSTCGFPLCCKQGLASDLHEAVGRVRAGKWGDYKCDVPLWMFANMIQHIKEFHPDIDMIYFTGDIIDHAVWNTSITQNSELIYWTYEQLNKYFPNKTVLPLLGNHEPSPLNVFAPSEPEIERKNLSTQWLYTLMSKVWRPWLPQEALATVRKEGYYAFNLNNKLKVIALNNNICYIYNWWLLYNTRFLEQQLTFLRKELEDSEARGQFVHILSHIPTGSKQCIQPWETSYNLLIRRFAHIIKGQFYGHEHTDELKIFYDEDNETPINVGFNGGSVTSYTNYNPNYKVMTVDPYSYEIIDIDTYIFNLTDANNHPDKSPTWFKLYSMKEAYGLDDLSPLNIHGLVEQMFSNDDMYCKYWRNYVKYGDPSLQEGCSQSNKKDILCRIITTESLAPTRKFCK